MFVQIQMILIMKTSISNNHISRLNETKKKGKETKQWIHSLAERKDESKENIFEINTLPNYLFFNGLIENFLTVPWGMKKKDKTVNSFIFIHCSYYELNYVRKLFQELIVAVMPSNFKVLNNKHNSNVKNQGVKNQ